MNEKEKEHSHEQGFHMLKLIPMNFPVCSEDLNEIFSQDEIR